MSKSEYSSIDLAPDQVDVELGENHRSVSSQDSIPDTNPDVNPFTTHYTCQICREENPNCGEYELSCCHQFCRECIVAYCTSKINDGGVDLKCPYVIEKTHNTPENNTENDTHNEENNGFTICNEKISRFHIHHLFTDNDIVMQKYLRFKLMKDNKNARQCPYCSVFNSGQPVSATTTTTPHTQSPKTTTTTTTTTKATTSKTPVATTPHTTTHTTASADTTTIQSRITCNQCHKHYCFYHSNAHDFDQYPTCAEVRVCICCMDVVLFCFVVFIAMHRFVICKS